MEDYKKKYEELYERISNLVRDYDCVSGLIDVSEELKSILNESQESEDERIRKSIIDLVEKQMPKSENKKWMIAWLEKQGEQKPNFCHHEVDLSGCSEEYRKAYYDGWNNCNQQHSQLKAEQKPAWSEEDEMKINGIVMVLESWDSYHVCSVGLPSLIPQYISWLDSLKERIKGE